MFWFRRYDCEGINNARKRPVTGRDLEKAR